MKRLFTTSIILFALLATSQAQALTWSWSFDELAGTFTTNTLMTPYETGTYTLDDFIVERVGTSGLVVGSIEGGTYFEDSPPSTFFWNATISEGSNFVRGEQISTWVIYTDNFDEVIIFSRDGVNGSALVGSEETSGLLRIAPVPVPAAAWLFMSGLIGLAWKGRKVHQSVA